MTYGRAARPARTLNTEATRLSNHDKVIAEIPVVVITCLPDIPKHKNLETRTAQVPRLEALPQTKTSMETCVRRCEKKVK